MLVQAPVAGGGAMIQQQMIVPGAPQSHVVQQQQQARPAAAGFVFTGIGHFCSHPALWLYALCPLCCGIIGIAIMIPIILATLFVPQHDWMMSWWGCDGGMCSVGAYFVALMLCLAEIAIGAIAFLQIALGFLMGEVFVKTMKDLGVWQGELASCGQQCTGEQQPRPLSSRPPRLLMVRRVCRCAVVGHAAGRRDGLPPAAAPLPRARHPGLLRHQRRPPRVGVPRALFQHARHPEASAAPRSLGALAGLRFLRCRRESDDFGALHRALHLRDERLRRCVLGGGAGEAWLPAEGLSGGRRRVRSRRADACVPLTTFPARAHTNF